LTRLKLKAGNVSGKKADNWIVDKKINVPPRLDHTLPPDLPVDQARELVDLSYAKKKSLVTVPGITESIAQGIIDFRRSLKKKGDQLVRYDQLEEVSGIGPGKVDALRDDKYVKLFGK
jgi:DNA uptake protein ComE-like DNA-binding protein